MKKDLILQGVVKQGLRVASGSNPDPTLKLNNTIFLQKPFFIKERIPHIEKMYNGTINLSIHPRKFKIMKPDYKVTCEWVEGVTETFWLVEAKIEFKNKVSDGYIYYPCPSKVKSHDDDTVELLAEKIDGVKYGDPISISLFPDKGVIV